MSKRRRARAKGPKTISKEGLSGQLGINLIERLVTDMGSRWIPGGPNEVGIDGYIELFDPSTRRPLGTTVAVQSKVVSSPENETDASFDYWCKAADLEYWLSNNIPVALIVSKPASGEAYWMAIQQYFADASRTGSTRVTFSKSDQRLTKDSLDQLLRVAVPKSMVYVAPLIRKETLHSNLLALVDVPPRLFVSGTDCRTGREVWGALRRIKADADGAWVAWDKKLYSFHDLSEEPWVSICEDGTHESFESTDWSESNDVERQQLFVELLNRALRSQLWPTVRFFPNEDCLAMTGKAAINREVVLKTHNLDELRQELERVFDVYGWKWDLGGPHFRSVKDLRSIIGELHVIDAGSYAFRYLRTSRPRRGSHTPGTLSNFAPQLLCPR